jgi:hypothetical protein
MALIDNQNVVARTFEVQAAAQQAIYQAEIAQKTLAQQIRKEAKAAPDLVETMQESDRARNLEVLTPEEQRRRQRGRAVPLRGGGVVQAPADEAAAALPAKGHVDIRV